MGTIWVKEFTGGLDARRLPETTPPGVMIRARDGHVTRGGEFHKRAAFVPEFSLPSGTVGLAATRSSLVVFGHAAAPVMPPGVAYQRLQHPGGSALVAVPSWDLFDGKIYAVGQFADGSTHHFYDGVRVTDWFDGRARASFRVVGGTASPASTLTNLLVNGVAAIASPVVWATSNEATAAAIAAAVNAHTSTPNYSAVASGDTVSIVAATAGPVPNGYAVAFIVADGLLLSPATGLVLEGGGTDGGATATAAFSFTTPAGVSGAATTLVRVGGVALTAAPVARGASATAAASAMVAAINAHTSTPNYTATSSGSRVFITTADRTAAVNGVSPTFEFTGLPSSAGAKASASFDVAGVTVQQPQGQSNEDPFYPTVLPRVNGVALTAAAINTATVTPGPSTDPNYLTAPTAAAIAAAINAHTSSPNYTATVSGTRVTVTAAADGAAANGLTFTFDITGFLTISNQTAFSGGADAQPAGTMVSNVAAFAGGAADDAFTPGTFVRTIGSKLYATAGSILHFSGIQAPTQWTTDAAGAGFINMATQNSGAEALLAVARYQNLLAVFARDVVLIWFVDPDPNLNTQSQLLGNTGAIAPRSVTQFGDADVFYLDSSGLRSLRARDSSNSAATTDIGVPVDDLLTAKLATLTDAEISRITGLINPIDKRFWLIVKDEIFVFSFYQNARVSAWSTYTTTGKVDGAAFSFEAEHAVTFGGRPYIRSGSVVFCYGGHGDDLTYDETEAEVWLPFLDAGRPTAIKNWTAIDAALSGLWEIKAATQPTNLDAAEVVARAYETTYNQHRVPYNHSSSHVSLRLKSKGAGPAVLSALAVHFEGREDET